MTASQNRRLKRAFIGIFVLLLLMAAWDFIPATSSFEQSTIDYRYAHFNRDASPSSRVVLVDIDEQSLKNLAPVFGRWPWPRRVYKEALEFLTIGEPSVILFDILFTEAQKGTDDDAIFGEASKASGLVSHALQFLPESSIEGVAHAKLPADITERFGLKWQGDAPTSFPTPMVFHDFLLPNPELFARIPRLHVTNVDKDADGILRRVPQVFEYDQSWLASLSLAGVLSQVKEPRLRPAPGQLEILEGQEPKYRVPLDRGNMLALHYYSDDKRPKSYRMAEVIESAAALQRGEVEDPAKLSVNPMDLAGKIVLVGTSATGLEDLKATPVSKSYPGVLLHATAISNILEGDFLRHPPAAVKFAVALLFILLSYAAVFFTDSIVLKVVVPVGGMLLYGVGAVFAFRHQSLALHLSMPIGLGLIAYVDSFIYMSFVEGRERKRMTGALSKYLSPEVARQMAEDGVNPTAEVGQKKELSILFSDVRGFTTMSEKMLPEAVVLVLNEYLGRMTDLVFQNKGTLDKFIGDAVMAFWGAPLDDSDHALKAVRTAMQMRVRLEELNREWATKGHPPFAIGVGVNTGPVIVGNIGSEKRLDYTVIGDNVNLASRIEGLTKQYHVEVLIGPGTYEKVKNEIVCRPIDLVRAKGKNDAVKIYEPLFDRSAAPANAADLSRLAEDFTAAWEFYKNGEFEKALKLFNEINTRVQGGDGPSQVYAERCLELLRASPTQWDGVYVAKSK